jgi:formylglycine-generating enzyme required for sulfatase activity
MPESKLESKFLDFHIIVNRIAEDKSDRFITMVADAPVSRYGCGFGQLGGSKPLRDLLCDLLETFNERVSLEQDKEKRYRLEQRGTGAPLTDQDFRQIGADLFQLLFPPGSESLTLLGQSCECALREKAYLRIKLDLHEALSDLPWEMMRPPLTGHWAVPTNQAKKVIVRYLGNIYEPTKPTITTPDPAMKPSILIIKADPKDLASSVVTESLRRERDRVGKLLKALSGRIHCEIIEEDTRRKLMECVRKLEPAGRPIIGLHFMGHGGVDDYGGYFAGEDGGGRADRIYQDDLRVALDGAESIQWIIFNACYTAVEPIGCRLAGLATSMAVLKNVPTVIAYERPVKTTEAEALAPEFYDLVLKQGRAIEDVIRSLQGKYKNPGGLVILERSVEGKVQEKIDLGPDDKQPRTKPRSAAQASPGGTGSLPPFRGPQPDQPPPIKPTVEVKMARVPSGPFQKGLSPQQVKSLIDQFRQHGLAIDLDSAEKTLSEEPPSTLELKEFYIDLTPVTNAQFSEFVRATRYVTDAERVGDLQNWRVNETPEKANHPIVYVSFNDARAYCEWAGKRLPTADEWEKAYRGPDGHIYPWGDVFDLNRCNTAENSRGLETTPVDQFPQGASSYGCLDMVGNVEEWTATPSAGGKVILGGSWAMTCMVYGLPVFRRVALPNFYSNDLGFRCAKDAADRR